MSGISIFCFISNPGGMQGTKKLLIAVPVLPAAIRALPGDPITGHPPLVFIHAGLADRKITPAIPAEHEHLPTAMAEF